MDRVSRMAERREKLALFDLDHTLIDGDSDVSWAQFLIEEGVLNPGQYHAKNMWFAERYKDGTLDINEVARYPGPGARVPASPPRTRLARPAAACGPARSSRRGSGGADTDGRNRPSN